MWKLGRAVLGGRESSIFDLPATMRGFRFSLDAMWTDVSRLNLIELVPALQMPVFFLLGRHDHWVPAEISVAVFRRTDRAVEEARLVRAVRPRAVRRRAGQVQRRDGGAGPACSRLRSRLPLPQSIGVVGDPPPSCRLRSRRALTGTSADLRQLAVQNSRRHVRRPREMHVRPVARVATGRKRVMRQATGTVAVAVLPAPSVIVTEAWSRRRGRGDGRAVGGRPVGERPVRGDDVEPLAADRASGQDDLRRAPGPGRRPRRAACRSAPSGSSGTSCRGCR